MTAHVGAMLYELDWNVDAAGRGYATWVGMAPNCPGKNCGQPLITDDTRNIAPVYARWADDYYVECDCGWSVDCA